MTHLPRDETFDRKCQQNGTTEHHPREVHQIIVPAIILHKIALDERRERSVPYDPESRRDQERSEKRPMGDDVPFLLGGSLYGLVDEERIMMAHKGECHNPDGWHYSGEVRKSPAIFLAWPESS